jgi:ADP-heptose:LPS heptosyltransferase
VFYLQLNNPLANYCKQDTPQKAHHRYDKHIIEQMCECYDIEGPELRCELYFSDEQHKKVHELTKEIDKDFIVIEPYSKTNYTPNRAYPFEKWQNIVDEVKKHIQVVQVGKKGNKILSGVVDFVGRTSFKEATLLIGQSKLFVSSEGGLVHAATAVNTKSVVIMTGYQNMKMVAYPQNININIANHGPCGLKILCKFCEEDAKKHDYNIITGHIMECLSE